MGPCLCGDPYCGSCGDPYLMHVEEAQEKLLENMHSWTVEEIGWLTENLDVFNKLFKLGYSTGRGHEKEFQEERILFITNMEKKYAKQE